MTGASPRKLLQPRKAPRQTRANHTVEAILQAAAELLERDGLASYNTNAIAARAGVSIGSLYQYFPGKDAITLALIEQEALLIVDAVRAALTRAEPVAALRALIAVAAEYQLSRPKLARLLDFEQDRLASAAPPSASLATVQQLLADFLGRTYALRPATACDAANDIISLIGALTDAAGRRDGSDAAHLKHRIEGAVLGYIATI